MNGFATRESLLKMFWRATQTCRCSPERDLQVASTFAKQRAWKKSGDGMVWTVKRRERRASYRLSAESRHLKNAGEECGALPRRRYATGRGAAARRVLAKAARVGRDGGDGFFSHGLNAISHSTKKTYPAKYLWVLNIYENILNLFLVCILLFIVNGFHLRRRNSNSCFRDNDNRNVRRIEGCC